MKHDISTLPPSPVQASVEASFTLRDWRYQVAEAQGIWTTTTAVGGRGGPSILELRADQEMGRVVARVDLALTCPTEHRRETALFLSWLNLWSDLVSFGMGPRTGTLDIRCGISAEVGSKISAETIDRMIAHLADRHSTFLPLLSRLVRGQISAEEGLRLLRLGV